MPRIPSSSRRQHPRISRDVLLLIAGIAAGLCWVWRRSRREPAPPPPDQAVRDGMRFEVHTVDMPTPSTEVTP